MATRLTESLDIPQGKRLRFKPRTRVLEEDFLIAFDFAMAMASGNNHRSNRSLGSKRRNPVQVFTDALEGKLGEFAFYRFALFNKLNVSYPDCRIQSKGNWDDGDFLCEGLKISIKTSSHASQLLLLEKDDYSIVDNKAVYRHGNTSDDAVFFVRLKVEFKNELSKTLSLEALQEMRDTLYQQYKILTEVTGYLSNTDIKNIIQHNFVIDKGEKLFGRITMDAPNYYLLIADLKTPQRFLNALRKRKLLPLVTQKSA